MMDGLNVGVFSLQSTNPAFESLLKLSSTKKYHFMFFLMFAYDILVG